MTPRASVAPCRLFSKRSLSGVRGVSQRQDTPLYARMNSHTRLPVYKPTCAQIGLYWPSVTAMLRIRVDVAERICLPRRAPFRLDEAFSSIDLNPQSRITNVKSQLPRGR